MNPQLWRKWVNDVAYVGTRSHSPNGDVFTVLRLATEEDHEDCMNGRMKVWETETQY